MADTELVAEPSAPQRRFGLLGLLTGLLFVLGLCGCLCAVTIFLNPRMPFNPFPPPTITPTPLPTATPTNTPRPPTRTPSPTATRRPTATPAVIALFDGGLTATRQYLPGRTCEDISFAGEVRDHAGEALTGYTVELVRDADGFTRQSLSGDVLAYGAGGWEVLLSDQPIHEFYRVRLLDPAGVEVGPALEPVQTSNNCDESLMLINFVEKGE
jgi:hypothetical protein